MNAITPFTLNQGQENAAEEFFQFLLSDEKEFIISGPGGVGKTRLMGYLIDKIMPRYYEMCKLMGIMPDYDSVHMTATTNKAAEALGLAMGRPTGTVHSFLNLTVKDDYSTGEQVLDRSKSWRIIERMIVFIDESSMIDQALYNALHETTHKCKIVYVGDHCQLAPVRESLSPIYRNSIRFVELTEPMRNAKQPALMDLCQQFRNTVETGIFNPIKLVPGVIDHLDDTAMQLEIPRVFSQQTHGSRILAFTNKRVVDYNDYIRQDIRHLGPEFTTGEFLISNTAVRLKGDMLSVEEEVEILSQSATIDHIVVEEGITLAVRKADLLSTMGGVYKDVYLPVDRDHFQELIKYYKRTKNWNRLFFLKNGYPDLRQRDAGTVHKVQGSTLDSVFIDLTNISTCNIANQVARMLYVAVSRPRNRIFLYGQLADRYGGPCQ